MRPATPADLSLVFDIYMDDTVNPFMFCEQMPLEAYRPLFELRLTRDYFWIFQDDNGTDCAMASAIRFAGRCQHVAEIQGVGIKQTFQGKGLGRRILTQIIDALKTDGITRIQLTAEADNPRALHLYASLGFTEEGRMHRFFKRESGEMVDEVMMGLLI